jgi:shikimate kinase
MSELRAVPRSLILIGMSGSGKTHWARRLAKHLGVPYIQFDDLTARHPELLAHVLAYDGKDMAEKMGRFFGMPWTENFQQREDVYLRAESAAMNADYDMNSILDLSGSGIYHTQSLERLKRGRTTIYLETGAQEREQMLQNYIQNPKPVCWRGLYVQNSDETQTQALSRCYHHLLNDRAHLYARYADITLSFSAHRNANTVAEFLNACGFLSPESAINQPYED